MEFFHANQADLEQDACEFFTNGALNESVKNLTEFLEGWDHSKPEGKILSWLVSLIKAGNSTSLRVSKVKVEPLSSKFRISVIENIEHETAPRTTFVIQQYHS